jgi:hypothetical protein
VEGLAAGDGDAGAVEGLVLLALLVGGRLDIKSLFLQHCRGRGGRMMV